MEEELVKFFDHKLLEDFGNKIRNQINRELEDFRKRKDYFNLIIIKEESSF